MKSHTGNLSCSCTSCTYRSESDRSSVRHFIKQGSRIDRLYYGKYIPLRERKLLERLVRTRGVYDDIRAQLVSNSSISLDNKAVLRPHRKFSNKKLDDNQKTRAILELVDRVDKGDHFESKDLSECCSCCSCSSKVNVHSKPITKQRNRQDHPHTNRYDSIRDNIVRSPYMRKGVRFKAKHVRSEPCTCTYKFSGMIKNKSKRKHTNKPIDRIDLQPATDEEITQKPRKLQNLARLSYEKLRLPNLSAKELMMEGVKKAKESKTRIQETLDKQAKKSFTKLNEAKAKINNKLKVQRKRPNIFNYFETSSCTCSQSDLITQIKKDSLIKFKDDLKKKKLMKNYECDSECIEVDCIPEECFNKLKQKLSSQIKPYDIKDNQNGIISKELMISKKITGPSIKTQQNKVVESIVTHDRLKQKPLLRRKENKSSQSAEKKKTDTRKLLTEENHYCECKSTNFNHTTKSIKSGTNITNIRNKKNNNLHQTRPATDPGKITINKKGKFEPAQEGTNQCQVVSIGSSFSFNIEFYKNRNVPKYDKPDIHLHRPLVSPVQKYSKGKFLDIKTEPKRFKRCFCSLKLKPKKSKAKRGKKSKKLMVSKESITTTLSTRYLNVETNTYDTYFNDKDDIKTREKNVKLNDYLLPYECEPGVCKPNKCDPFKCIKLINKRNRKVKKRSTQSGDARKDVRSLKNKSTTSFNLTPRRKNKLVYPMSTINRENNYKNYPKYMKETVYSTENNNDNKLVRIGSSISFSLEFNKNKLPNPIKFYNSRIQQDNFEHKSIFYKPAYNKGGFGNTLKRCFCTLKLQDKKVSSTKKNKKVITNIDLIQTQIMTFNKSTKTKNSSRLKPYECEPFTCIPGSCNPYICLERIKERDNNFKEIGSTTHRPKTKTVSSITHTRKSFRNIQILSKPKSIARKTSVPTWSQDYKECSSSALTKSSVKIGSTFSCSLEFFKTNKKISEPLNVSYSTSFSAKKIKKYPKKIITNTNTINKLNVSDRATQKKKPKKNDKSMASHIVKRCFCTLNLNKYRRHRDENSFLNNKIITPIEYTINRASIGPGPNFTNKEYRNVDRSSGDEAFYGCLKNESKPYPLIPFQIISSSLLCVSFQKLISNDSDLKQNLSRRNLLSKEVTNISQYLKNNFCAMNVQFANNVSKPKRSKVTLGSNFSFNVDISKKYIASKKNDGQHSSSRIKYSSDKNHPNNLQTIGTKNKITHRNRMSQSDLSNFSSVRKKCFCTLKLQKKGRLHKNTRHMLKPSILDQSKTTVKSADKAQNTQMRPLKITHSLKPYKCEPNMCSPGYCNQFKCLEIVKRKKHKKLASFQSLNISSLEPYECEPNICVPGYCDPYQCLEVIKKRNFYKHTKQSGIETIMQATKSAATLTERNHVVKGTQGNYRGEVKKKYTNVHQTGKFLKSDVLKPSKKLVRVGSNISFSVEFFKEQKTPQINYSTYNNLETKNIFKELSKSKQKMEQVESSTPSKVNHRNINKQIEIRQFPKNVSTMTMSFIKQCFCTAKLQNKNSKNIKKYTHTKDITSPSFIKKCFCILKSIKASKVVKQGIYLQKNPHVHKKIGTKIKESLVEQQRKDYECEPGICIPGECDPYECEKKKKKSKTSKVSTITETRSMGINSPEMVKKNANVQSKVKYKQEKKLKPSKVSFKGDDRKAVKIGSNFSFNIEFYKEKYDKSNKSLKFIKDRSMPEFKNLNKQINKTLTRSRLSQSVSTTKSDRATDGQHFLKRCFCTLKLNSQYAREPKDKNKKYRQLKLSSKSMMTEIEDGLEYFECEPNTCVPYQCNPYECLKNINLRREKYRETGTLTQRPRKYSVSSKTSSAKRSKRITQTLVPKNHYRKETFNINDNKSRPIQKVKIGSSFDFNMEFIKNTNQFDLDAEKKAKATYKINKNQPRNTVQNIYNNKKQIQRNRQINTSHIRKQSNSSQTKRLKVPNLKRCFCTLFFKRSKKNPKLSINKTLSRATETRKLPERVILKSYECEPLTCVPGECDPYACLEQIKNRNLKNVGENTLHTKTKTTANVTLNRPKIKSKKSQYIAQYRNKKDQLQSDTKILKHPEKQAVKIGSNFNLNIEFYKNKNVSFDKSKTNSEQIRTKKAHKVDKFTKDKLKYQHKKECDKSKCPEFKKVHKVPEPSSQKKTKRDKDKFTHKFMKKCFCVLKLIGKKRKPPPPNLVQSFDKKNVVPYDHYTQNKLLPYECEPNFCVSGECDPYECKKRIKSRLLENQKQELFISKAAATDKLKPKSIKLQVSNRKLKERKQKQNENDILERHTGKNAVRVGSTFSFDVEFFKENNNRISEDDYSRKKQRRNMSTNKKIITDNKTVVSRGSRAYKCAPDCHKYTSLDRKSYNISTQVLNKCSNQCVGVSSLYQKRNRSNYTNKLMTTPSKTLNYHNKGKVSTKQAVTIGSNFKFNIEFYKQISPQAISQSLLKHYEQNTSEGNGIDDINKKKKTLLKQNHQSQAVVKKENKSSDVQNALKRCFCTYKLQKNVHFKKNRNNETVFGKIPLYPQTVEVRRLNVLHEHKSPSKINTSVRTVATKVNKKYIKENVIINSPCKCSIRKNGLLTNLNDMETILPYKPTKFKRTSSKTLLEIDPKHALKNKKKISKTTNNRGKKLKKTKSARNIYNEKRFYNLTKFLCRCAAVFTSKYKNNVLQNDYEAAKTKSENNTDRQSQKFGFERLKISKSDRGSTSNPNAKLKKTKSLKLSCRCCDKCIMNYEDNNTAENAMNVASIDKRKYKNKDKIKYNTIHNKNFHGIDAEGNNKNKQTFRKHESYDTDRVICNHCQTLRLSEKTNNVVLEDFPTTTSNKYTIQKKNSGDKKSKRLSKNNKFCHSCGRLFVKEEMQKGAGDRSNVTFNEPYKDVKHKKKNKKNNNNIKCEVKTEKMPLFEMRLSTDDYDIINKKEVKDNVAKLTFKETSGHLKLRNMKPKINEKRNPKINDSEKYDKFKKTKSIKHIPEKENSHINQDYFLKNENKILCGICQQNVKKIIGKGKQSPPSLKVHFSDTNAKDNIKEKSKKTKIVKHNTKSKVSSEYQMQCHGCGQKCIRNEIKKVTGDHPLNGLGKENVYLRSINKIKEILNLHYDSDNICSGDIKQEPLFEMHLGRDDYDIINKEQFMDNVTKYSRSNTHANKKTKLHKKNCRCCICLSRRHKTGARIHISPKGSKIGKIFNTKAKSNQILLSKPCTCGSFVCSKSVKKMHESTKPHKRRLWTRPCVCGSPVCNRESAAIKAISPDKITCICQEENKKKKRKMKMIKNEAEAKQHAIRRKLLNKEDSIRREKRLKEDKEMEKRINKKASDIVLLAESAIDIGKLGITAAVDILRSVARTASNPKHAYYTLKAMKDDPQLMASHLKTAFNDSGVASTARRVRLRCMAMKGVKKVKNSLEKYAFSNYLLHIADKDPKKRLIKKKKPIRVREQLDFACSLYMASLRKRPYLSVYNRCPWFYPHFLSLLNVWKQFSDITLFLLAVVVWSPCILCMEVCRAMMCCFFCTG